jgi:hypothetical protein
MADHLFSCLLLYDGQRVRPRPTSIPHGQRAPRAVVRGELDLQELGVGRATYRIDRTLVLVEVNTFNPASAH